MCRKWTHFESREGMGEVNSKTRRRRKTNQQTNEEQNDIYGNCISRSPMGRDWAINCVLLSSNFKGIINNITLWLNGYKSSKQRVSVL